jgi:hypothetical protein
MSAKARISTAVRLAIIAMVDEGRSRAEAALAYGITDDWLYRALQRPECRALKNERLKMLRENAASRSTSRVDKLADTAQSEHVRLGANELLLGIEGIAPVQRVEHRHEGLQPGLTVIFAQPEPMPHIIEGKAINSGPELPEPVPHPALRDMPRLSTSVMPETGGDDR